MPPHAHAGCVLVGDFFSWCVQGILGISSILLLWIKRLNENPKRESIVWALDVCKQCLGATFGHFLNIWLAGVFSRATEPRGDTCQWYLILFVGDTSIGVVLNVLLLQLYANVAVTLDLSPLGEYGTPPDPITWALQLLIWLLILVVSKIGVVIFFMEYVVEMRDLTDHLFKTLEPHPNLELIVVMVLVPFVLNTICFWIQDNFLKEDTRNRVINNDSDDNNLSGSSSRNKISDLKIEMNDMKTSIDNKSINNNSNNNIYNHKSNISYEAVNAVESDVTSSSLSSAADDQENQLENGSNKHEHTNGPYDGLGNSNSQQNGGNRWMPQWLKGSFQRNESL